MEGWQQDQVGCGRGIGNDVVAPGYDSIGLKVIKLITAGSAASSVALQGYLKLIAIF